MRIKTDDLILLNMAGVGYRRLTSLMESFGDTSDILKKKERDLKKANEIGPVLARRISSAKESFSITRERRLMRDRGVRVVTLFEEGYPELLKNIYDPPIVLYIKGGLERGDRTAVAMVGSRKASYYGIETCTKLSRSLSGSGITVVSGLARGIDSAAHKGALMAGGRTIAVLGNGLASIYPPENAKLSDRIALSGAVVTEFPMESPPLAMNFPVRNRIISGLSLGVVVVEAAARSGSLITADLALEEGREVFAVPGRAGSATSKGAHGLIKKGAKLVDRAEDIIEELNIVAVPQNGGTGELEGEEKRIYDILSEGPEQIDAIADKSDMPAGKVSRILTKLEIKRFVKELPGKNFMTAA
jgi:DNA processing protein